MCKLYAEDIFNILTNNGRGETEGLGGAWGEGFRIISWDWSNSISFIKNEIFMWKSKQV